MFKKMISRIRTRVLTPSSGQAILLIALASVGLIAVMGLSIDGGRMLYLQRKAQTTADAVALAATRDMCLNKPSYIQTALNTAAANGFNNDGTNSTVKVNVPPQHANVSISPECQGCYLEAVVEGRIPGTFISMFYNQPLQTTGTSIAACNPNISSNPDGIGLRALWAIGTGCSPFDVTVTGASIIINGGVHTNGTVRLDNCYCDDSQTYVTGPVSYVDDVKINYDKTKITTGDFVPQPPSPPESVLGRSCASTCFGSSGSSGGSGSGGSGGGGSFTCTDPQSFPGNNPFKVCKKSDPLALNVNDFAPGNRVQTEVGNDYYHAYSGECKNTSIAAWFNGLKDAGGVLAPGVYYTTCDVQFNNGSVGNLKGNITLVSTKNIQIQGTHQLSAYYHDLLFFADSGGTSASCKSTVGIKISNDNNYYVGNFYAPHGQVNFSGKYNYVLGCIVGWSVSFSGSSNTVNCQPTNPDFSPAPQIWLTQ